MHSFMIHSPMIKLTTLFVVTSLSLYVLLISFQGISLIFERFQRTHSVPQIRLPVFFENIGIALAIYGYLARDSALMCMAALFVALRLIYSFERFERMPRQLELPLLSCALATFALMALAKPL
ncbi:MAG: hypothetical protein V3V17_02910 [Alphaproteobacteria bacterium]